jgi:hypothetical protein
VAIKIVAAIQQALNTIPDCHALAEAAISASHVSPMNRHRCLLERVRNDLWHFDDEKRARIIRNINRHLTANAGCSDDPELLDVLGRILEVVQNFQSHQTVLTSPVKPLAPPRVTSGRPTVLFED